MANMATINWSTPFYSFVLIKETRLKPTGRQVKR